MARTVTYTEVTKTQVWNQQHTAITCDGCGEVLEEDDDYNNEP